MPVHIVRQQGSNYAVRLDAADNTSALLGIIQCRSTTGRPSPPQPHNGFNTAYTPFGNGHVLALSLGGTDEARNIVPQWEQWQQTGTWRKVEEKCEGYDKHLFRCDISYNAAAANNYVANQSQFAQDPLSPWSHPGLPVSLRVQVYGSSHTSALAAVKDDATFDSLHRTLDRAAPVYDSGVLDHSVMPAEDVKYWQDKIIAGLASTAHTKFASDEEQRVTTATTAFVSTISLADFVLHPTTLAHIKALLQTRTGFTRTQVAGLQAERILLATHAMKSSAVNKARQAFNKNFLKATKKIRKREKATVSRLKTARELRNQKRAGTN